MRVGMVLSNEPGYYEDGAFGVRIENLLIVKEADTQYRFGGQSYLCFERLTWCPLQRKMLAPEVCAQLTRQCHCITCRRHLAGRCNIRLLWVWRCFSALVTSSTQHRTCSSGICCCHGCMLGQVMTQREVDWVDEYHMEVWDKVSPRLQDQPEILEWLRINTAPLQLNAPHLRKREPALAAA